MTQQRSRLTVVAPAYDEEEVLPHFHRELCRVLEALGDESLRAVARWRMEGWTNREIAARLGCVEQTVERKLRSIRRLWTGEVGS